jgi:hypothetical protein
LLAMLAAGQPHIEVVGSGDHIVGSVTAADIMRSAIPPIGSPSRAQPHTRSSNPRTRIPRPLRLLSKVRRRIPAADHPDHVGSVIRSTPRLQ